MTEQTKKYRQDQLEKVSTVYNEFKTKIQIINPNGQTNWIDIENEELAAIVKVLMK